MRQVPKYKLLPIFLIILFDEIGLTVGTPVLPSLCFDPKTRLFVITTSHAVRSMWYGILSGLPHVIAIAAAALLSIFSDYWGRKKILLLAAISVLIYCLFTAIGIFYGYLSFIILGGLISGLCARTEPIASAVVADHSTAERKLINMGYLQLFISIGAFIGPLIGGLFAERFFFKQLNFSAPFILGTLFSIVTFLLVNNYFKESYTPKKESNIFCWHSFTNLLNKQTVAISILLILTQISWRTYYQFMPAVLKINLHANTLYIGVFVALISLYLSLAALFGLKWFSNWFDVKKIARLSVYVLFIGLIVNAIATISSHHAWSKSLLWIAALPIAAADVIVYCVITTLFSNAVSAENQGKIMGLNYMLVMSVWAITGFAGGLLGAINISLPIWLTPLPLLPLIFYSKIFEKIE